MPLVDYGSTDDEGDEPSQTPKQAAQPAVKPAGLFASLPAPKSANSLSGTPSLFAALPPPKTHPAPASSRPEPPKKKVKIYVDVPAPEPEEESPSGHATTVAKPAPTSLFACLPAPKKAAAPAGRVAAPLLPPQVGKKVVAKTSTNLSLPPKLPSLSAEEADEQIDPDSFFTLSEPTFDREALDEPTPGVAAPPPGPSASAQYAYPSASAQYAYSKSAQYAYPPQQSYPADDGLYQPAADLSEAAVSVREE
ncbi:hypothetical protein HDU87_002866 [Geranomyces variabilis]|uniref:Uncharacterized protein n=1 Tax=Geranomyces variabilis TaxID=109894 RepID=A0AAD5TL39_9FUNG|nr:hypothetical protein HDU87_002866 [Geranomyces variabilis]